MKEFLKANWRRFVAAFLIISVFGTSSSLECFAIEASSEQQTEETVQEEMTEEASSDAVCRANVIESENTENSTTYDTGEGTWITEIYAQDIRFMNEEGVLVDYDASLVEIENPISSLGNLLENYEYENKAGDKKQYFPEVLSQETPVLMEHGEKQIRFAPIEMAAEAVSETENGIEADVTEQKGQIGLETVQDIYTEESLQAVKVFYPSVKEGMSYQYTSLDIGVREEVIFSAIPEDTSYSFLLEIPGMTIRENMLDEGLTIYKDDEIVAMVQAPYLNDATGEAYSEAVTSTLEVVDETAGIYCVTVSAEEEYLNSETLNYPVTVASDFTWQDEENIEDQYVLSNYPNYNYYDTGITSC